MLEGGLSKATGPASPLSTGSPRAVMAVADSSQAAADGMAPGTVIPITARWRERRPLASARRRSEQRPRAPTITPTPIRTTLRRHRRPVAITPIRPATEAKGAPGRPRRRLWLRMPRIEGMLVEGGIMPKNKMTRRAALLSLGAFGAAALSGCNTTPTAGVQPGAASRAWHRRHQCRYDAPGGLRRQSDRGLGATGAARRARPGSRDRGARRAPAQRAYRHPLSRRRRAGRSRPDERRREARRTHDHCAGGIDILLQARPIRRCRSRPCRGACRLWRRLSPTG